MKKISKTEYLYMEKILITGASGFIGSCMVEQGLERGMQVWAGVRGSSSRRYLADPRTEFAELNLNNKEQLVRQLLEHKHQHGGWDYIIHAAGATKCLHKDDFMRTNYEGTRNLVEALKEVGIVPRMFVFVSSLSVCGPVREQMPYKPILPTDTPQPNTAYAESKLRAEEFLKQSEIPFVILRPTGVYGPRERDYFLMFKSIKSGLDTAVGFRQQDITFIYVADLVEAAFLALTKGVCGRQYMLSDGHVYSSRAFSDLIQRELGKSFVLHLTFPLCVLKVVSLCAEKVCAMLGKSSTLNSDKYNIMKQRNWQCDISDAQRDLGYTPQFNLERGVHLTAQWYKENKWI